MGSGCLASGQRIGSRIHIKGAYCVGKDDGVGKAAAQDIGLSERRILTGLLLLKSSRS